MAFVALVKEGKTGLTYLLTTHTALKRFQIKE